MISRASRIAAIGLGVVGLGFASAPAGTAQDARAIAVLEDANAYVSQRALGPASAQAQKTLAEAAAELNGEGRDVKLAIVPGPIGAPSMRAYARRLRRDLGYPGTLAVTAPGRPTVAVGPLPPATITIRLRSPQVANEGNPVTRVVAAGQLATPEPEESGATREILLLLGLGVLGAAWAVAWGLRRERRGGRAELAERRGWSIVCLDAIDARAAALRARGDLSERASQYASDAEQRSAIARDRVAGADRTSGVTDAIPDVRSAFDSLEAAAAAAGEPLDVEHPFAGLCAVDPSHGRASEPAPVEDVPARPAVCASCARANRRGEQLEQRKIPVRGHPVPFDQMPRDLLHG